MTQAAAAIVAVFAHENRQMPTISITCWRVGVYNFSFQIGAINAHSLLGPTERRFFLAKDHKNLVP